MSDNRKKMIIISIELVIIGILFICIGFNELKKDKVSGGTKASGAETAVSDVVDIGDPGIPEASVEDAAGQEDISDPVDYGDPVTPAQDAEGELADAADEQEGPAQEDASDRDGTGTDVGELLEEADLKAAMYDYDTALELVTAYEGWEDIPELADAVASYTQRKEACVKWADNTTISHIFFHSLIVDTSRAFGPGSSQVVGYNRYMTTVDEFNRMLEQLYERGYVLVSPHDMAERVVAEDGTEKLVTGQIWLPEGKTPIVMSQDDVNYYLYMDNDGFADRLVVGEDGLPTCKYIEKDGTVLYGEYDLVPILDRFIREHPDFSYRGRKAILAVTGYEGALGYDTGLSMKIYDGMSDTEKMKLIEEERVRATEVADALKADGYEFASHSYTHTSMDTNSVSKVEYDLRRWNDEVRCILGDTDIYIYPYGADICDWRGYSGEKFDLMREYGFWYFCNVDSARYWVQIRDGYFRQGRINADGERMVKNPEKLEYFFDVDSVFDRSRPELKF